MGKTNQKPPKTLNPRPAPAAANLDVLIAVDGSSSLKGPDFDQEKRIINALAARMGQGSQLGVIQFGSTAQIISSLTTDMSELEAKVANMAQIGGGTNLLQALEHCHTEFGLSKFPKNSKQIWIVTDGGYDQPKPTALYATKIAREKQATIYGIGVGKGVTQASLNQVCSLQCAYMVEDFEHAVKIMKADVEKDLYMQLHAEIVFKEEIPLKLGQETFIRLEITNHGRKPLLAGSKIIFKGNDYFREKFAVLPENINPGEDLTLEDVKLVPKIKGNRANLDSQILSLPPLLEVSAQDNTGHEIYLDCTGFYLNHEDFSGDIYQYTPVYPEFPLANIITFGPPGAGKSSFVNSVISALGDQISTLSVAGATRDVVTATLTRFPLNKLPETRHLKLALYDAPGLDGKNYKGEELALMMYGLMPIDVDFKHNAAYYNTIRGRRSSSQEEFERQAHVVAFFVPQGSAADSEVMNRLAGCLYKITVEHKRKAIVIISRADEIPGEEDKADVLENVCQALSIDSSNVFFLENYVGTKDKQFTVDKNVLRILLAMVARADDFLMFNKLNPIMCPFEKNPSLGSSHSTPPSSPGVRSEPKGSPAPARGKAPASPQVTKQPTPAKGKSKPVPKTVNFVDEFLEKLPEMLREKMRVAVEEHGVDDEDTIRSMSKEEWKEVGFGIGDLKKIEKALSEL